MVQFGDHFRSNLGIISGLEIICGRGSFAVLYSSEIQTDGGKRSYRRR